MMLIGKFWDEPTLYRAAHAFEQSGDWQSWGRATRPAVRTRVPA
jgi:Asp-tRNA(Asn)/Glu-tRNA(Gln) amidotransferase A subunit family amidase